MFGGLKNGKRISEVQFNQGADFANTVLKDWDASELDTVMDIMGLSKEGMEAPEDKISAIEKYLADYKHEVEMRGGIDGARVDGIPAKDQGSTLFEGPSEAEVVSKMLNPFSKGQ